MSQLVYELIAQTESFVRGMDRAQQEALGLNKVNELLAQQGVKTSETFMDQLMVLEHLIEVMKEDEVTVGQLIERRQKLIQEMTRFTAAAGENQRALEGSGESSAEATRVLNSLSVAVGRSGNGFIGFARNASPAIRALMRMREEGDGTESVLARLITTLRTPVGIAALATVVTQLAVASGAGEKLAKWLGVAADNSDELTKGLAAAHGNILKIQSAIQTGVLIDEEDIGPALEKAHEMLRNLEATDAVMKAVGRSSGAWLTEQRDLLIETNQWLEEQQKHHNRLNALRVIGISIGGKEDDQNEKRVTASRRQLSLFEQQVELHQRQFEQLREVTGERRDDLAIIERANERLAQQLNLQLQIRRALAAPEAAEARGPEVTGRAFTAEEMAADRRRREPATSTAERVERGETPEPRRLSEAVINEAVEMRQAWSDALDTMSVDMAAWLTGTEEGLQTLGDMAHVTFGGFADLFRSMVDTGIASNRRFWTAFKAFSIAEAVTSTYVAANRALASAPPPFNYALAAGVVAAGLANVARIRAMEPGGAGGTPATSGPRVSMGISGQAEGLAYSHGGIEPRRQQQGVAPSIVEHHIRAIADTAPAPRAELHTISHTLERVEKETKLADVRPMVSFSFSRPAVTLSDRLDELALPVPPTREALIREILEAVPLPAPEVREALIRERVEAALLSAIPAREALIQEIVQAARFVEPAEREARIIERLDRVPLSDVETRNALIREVREAVAIPAAEEREARIIEVLQAVDVPDVPARVALVRELVEIAELPTPGAREAQIIERLDAVPLREPDTREALIREVLGAARLTDPAARVARITEELRRADLATVDERRAVIREVVNAVQMDPPADRQARIQELLDDVPISPVRDRRALIREIVEVAEMSDPALRTARIVERVDQAELSQLAERTAFIREVLRVAELPDPAERTARIVEAVETAGLPAPADRTALIRELVAAAALPAIPVREALIRERIEPAEVARSGEMIDAQERAARELADGLAELRRLALMPAIAPPPKPQAQRFEDEATGLRRESVAQPAVAHEIERSEREFREIIREREIAPIQLHPHVALSVPTPRVEVTTPASVPGPGPTPPIVIPPTPPGDGRIQAHIQQLAAAVERLDALSGVTAALAASSDKLGDHSTALEHAVGSIPRELSTKWEGDDLVIRLSRVSEQRRRLLG